VPYGGRIAFGTKQEHWQKFLVQEWEVSKTYLLGYERDNPSYEYLKTRVLNDPSSEYQGTQTTYTANLDAAQAFFRGKLRELQSAQLETLFKTLTQKFLFNVYELEEELDVFVVFETMNNRGKPLSKLELLKNRLIYLSTLLPESTRQADKTALRRNINDAWKIVYEYLGREKESPLDDDEFLRAHWIIFFRYARDEAGQFSRFLLGTHFTTQHVTQGRLSISELQRYVDSIQRSARKWHAIHFPASAEGLSQEVSTQLEKLVRLGTGAFEPLILAAMLKYPDNADLPRLLIAAEKFVFLVSRLSQRRSDTGDSEFYRLAGQLYRGEKTLLEAISTVDSQTSYFFSAEKATLNLRELLQKDGGFYSWDGVRYLLFEYEQNLRERSGVSTARLSWEVLKANKRDMLSLEHIYPVTPGDNWPSFASRSELERLMLRGSLGNLLALSRQRNSRFSNRPFVEKKQDGEFGYFNGSYSEINVSQSEEWTPQAILNRGLEILDFLEVRWGVSLGSRYEKVKLLGLEFLEPTEA